MRRAGSSNCSPVYCGLSWGCARHPSCAAESGRMHRREVETRRYSDDTSLLSGDHDVVPTHPFAVVAHTNSNRAVATVQDLGVQSRDWAVVAESVDEAVEHFDQ